jgi:periplasmic copper chaperone A
VTARRRPGRRRALATALALAGGLALAGCGGGPPRLTAYAAYIPQPVTGDMAGGFLKVRNTGDSPDKLTSVTSPLAGTVQMHTTHGGQMRQVDSLTVPADGILDLGRGGNHLMFLHLKRKLVEGDSVRLELHFATSDPITLTAPVRATNFNPDVQ